MFTNKIILIAPLDWGLGHATRCVPIIRELEINNKIILGVTPLTSTILEEEFPQLPKISLPEYKIRYSTFLPIWLKLIFDSRRISKVIKAEHDLGIYPHPTIKSVLLSSSHYRSSKISFGGVITIKLILLILRL